MYARGKYARGICDRCGLEYPYLTLREEWTGLKVCASCWDPKHPRLEPRAPIRDPQGLRDPNPDNNDYFTPVLQLDALYPPTSGRRPYTITVTDPNTPILNVEQFLFSDGCGLVMADGVTYLLTDGGKIISLGPTCPALSAGSGTALTTFINLASKVATINLGSITTSNPTASALLSTTGLTAVRGGLTVAIGASVSETLTGYGNTTTLGTLSILNDALVVPTGIAATSAQGSISVLSNATTSPSGQMVAASQGTISVDVESLPTQTGSYYSNNINGTVSGVTISSVTPGAGSNTKLIVVVGAEGSTEANTLVSGVTFDGNAMTKIDDNTVGSGYYCGTSAWYYDSPGVSAANVVVTMAGNCDSISASACTIQDAASGAAVVEAENTGTSSPLTTSLTTTTTNNLVLILGGGGFGADASAAPTANGTGTSDFAEEVGNSTCCFIGAKPMATAASTGTIGWASTGFNRGGLILAAFAPA